MNSNASQQLNDSHAKTVNLIGLGFIAAIVLMIGLVFFGLLQINAAYETQARFVASKLLHGMQDELRKRATLVSAALQAIEPHEREKILQHYAESTLVLANSRQTLQDLNLTSTERTAWDTQRELVDNLELQQQEIIDLVQGGNLTEASHRYTGKIVPAQEHTLRSFSEILDQALQDPKELSAGAKEKRTKSGTAMIVGGALASILTILMALIIRQRHINLVSQLSREATSCAATLRELELQKQALDQHSLVSITDVKGNITYANQKFIEVSGYSREELLGQNHRVLKSGRHPASFYEVIWRAVSCGERWHGFLCNRAKNDKVYWADVTIIPFMDKSGLPYQYVSVQNEVTQLKDSAESVQHIKEKLDAQVLEHTRVIALVSTQLQAETERCKQLESNLHSALSTDSLTGIDSRLKFDKTLDLEISRADRYNTPLCLILFGLDHHSKINEELGHHVGDEMLADLAAHVSEKIRSHDVFARFGGEEFAILAPGNSMPGGNRLADKLRAGIALRRFHGDSACTCSFGVAEHQRGDTAESFIKRAEKALLRAQTSGRNRVEEER